MMKPVFRVYNLFAVSLLLLLGAVACCQAADPAPAAADQPPATTANKIVFSAKPTDDATGVTTDQLFVITDTDKKLKAITDEKGMVCKFPVFSSDGEKIAFTMKPLGGKEDIYLLSRTGEKIALTKDAEDNTHPNFSHDGTKIVFSSTRGGVSAIYTMEAKDGGNPTLVTKNVKERCYEPIFSKDDKKIYFVLQNAKGFKNIFCIDADGATDPVPLTNNGGISPAVSPDGAKIVYASKNQIWGMNADGTGLKALTKTEDFSAKDPTFSPDGKQIYFIARVAGVQGRLYVMDADGTNAKAFFTEDTTAVASTPSCATVTVVGVKIDTPPPTDPKPKTDPKSDPKPEPAATGLKGKLVFVSDGGLTQSDLYLLDLESKEAPKRVTFDGASKPTFLPDGDTMIYSANHIGTPSLYSLKLSTRAQKRLTMIFNNAREPAVNADGKLVTYTRGGNIFICGLDGGNFQAVTNAQDMEEFMAPQFSPDGMRLLYQSNQNGRWDVFEISGTNTRQVTTDDLVKGGMMPTYSPDAKGKYIALSAFADGAWNIYIIETSNMGVHAVQMTTAGNNFDPAFSPDGKSLAFSSDRDGKFNIYVMSVMDKTALNTKEGVPAVQVTKSAVDSRCPVWLPAPAPVVVPPAVPVPPAPLVEEN